MQRVKIDEIQLSAGKERTKKGSTAHGS